jgi:hypothetical protein
MMRLIENVRTRFRMPPVSTSATEGEPTQRAYDTNDLPEDLGAALDAALERALNEET